VRYWAWVAIPALLLLAWLAWTAGEILHWWGGELPGPW
jgi:hypothetical protein